MLKNIKLAVFLLAITSSVGFAQSGTLSIVEVSLSLGMPRDIVMKKLATQYKVTERGEGSIFIFNSHSICVGNVNFDKERISYISKNIDTTGWPNDEGFAIARAIYEAIQDSVSLTESDGVKRTTAKIVIKSVELNNEKMHGTLRRLDIYVDERKIMIFITDSPEAGKSVQVSVAVSAKPW